MENVKRFGNTWLAKKKKKNFCYVYRSSEKVHYRYFQQGKISLIRHIGFIELVVALQLDMFNLLRRFRKKDT